MSTRPILVPNSSHPITIERSPSRVVVMLAGKVVADTVDALTMREASLPPVQYIPRKDVDHSGLVASRTSTYCPFKGDASYFSIPAGGDRSVDAAWTYEEPFEAVAAIAGHLAFYPDRIDAIEERAAP